MNKDILNTGVQDFISQNPNADIMSVLLKKPIFLTVSNKELAEQLEARKKCQKKLPTWFNTARIYYPNKLSIEQTSSEITARYKSEIVSRKTNEKYSKKSHIDGFYKLDLDAVDKPVSDPNINSLVDLTGGFGVDSYYFAQKVKQVVHCEIEPNLSQIAAHNFEVLDVDNIVSMTKDGMDYLRNAKERFDWIYLDPSRRDPNKGKVFRLSECSPDITEHLNLFYNKSNNILLKTSPLLDFSIGIDELRFVKEIHVIAVKNEVKELLWILEKDYSDGISVKTINFLDNKSVEIIPPKKKDVQRFKHSEDPSLTNKSNEIDVFRIPFESFNFESSKEREAISEFSTPLSYLYEPNAAILKSGAFKTVGHRFNLKKLHEHTHLYTSETKMTFPGRRFKIVNTWPYNKKRLKSLGVENANITTRNFPKSVASIRKTFKIEEGGTIYLFFITDLEGQHRVIQCSKI